MTRLRLYVFLLLSWITLAATFDLKGKVAWNDVCANITALGQARVVLDNGRLYGGITADGSFTVPEVPIGSYLLSVINHDYVFENLRVDVTNETAHVHPYTLGTPFNPPSTVNLPYPMVITPKEKLDFYAPPHSFNLYSLLTNPMVLFGIGGLVLFGLNSLIDVESLKEAMKEEEPGSTQQRHSIPDVREQARVPTPRKPTKKLRR